MVYASINHASVQPARSFRLNASRGLTLAYIPVRDQGVPSAHRCDRAKKSSGARSTRAAGSVWENMAGITWHGAEDHDEAIMDMAIDIFCVRCSAVSCPFSCGSWVSSVC